MPPVRRTWPLLTLLLALAACGADRRPGAPPDPNARPDAAPQAPDTATADDASDPSADASDLDGGAPADDAAAADAAPAPDTGPVDDAAAPDAATNPDAAPADDAAADDAAAPDASAPDAAAQPTDAGTSPTVACPNAPIPAPPASACGVTSGTNAATLVRANLITPAGYLENAHLLIEAGGTIACAACDCSSHAQFSGATRVECPSAVVSPGLINAHDHLAYNTAAPLPPRSERYEHRHDWRTGRNGHTNLSTTLNNTADALRWGELRHLLAGTTAISGANSVPGLLRNVDSTANLEGLAGPAVRNSVFPLGDTNGTTRTNDCAYPSLDTPSVLANVDAYTPHVAEGIDDSASNEFRCLSGAAAGAVALMTPKTAVIDGIGLRAQDLATMASAGSSLIWSPRSNLDLYGHTALVTTARSLGVRIVLGTDWVPTGSMNLLRELRCADDYNRNFLGGTFSDRELVDQVTQRAAEALHLGAAIGSLSPGLRADVAIFDGQAHPGYRAILDAASADVVLVMRSGAVLYGDDALVTALGGSTGCELLDVCGRAKRVCVQRDTGTTLAALRTALGTPYPLFACGAPQGEPACLPVRPGEFTGMSVAGDQDGDGLPDGADNCPTVFNPPRPMDLGVQPNADGDAFGDACDRCPLAVACP